MMATPGRGMWKSQALLLVCVCMVFSANANWMRDGTMLRNKHVMRFRERDGDAHRHLETLEAHRDTSSLDSLEGEEFSSPSPSFVYYAPVCPVHVGEGTFSLTPPLLLFLSAFAALAAISIALWYNFVQVYDQRVQSQNISNNRWVLYFSYLAARAALNLLEFGFADDSHVIKANFRSFHFASLILHGLNALALGLAVNHQRIYRSGVDTTGSGKWVSATAADIKSSLLEQSVKRSEMLVFILFLVHIVALYLRALFPHSSPYFWLYMASMLGQRIPILWWTGTIVFKRSSIFGPNTHSKVLLGLGILLNFGNDVPLSVWSEVLPRHSCIFSFFSSFDLIICCLLFSAILLFAFTRREFLRNREECIWATYLSHIDHDPFDYRLF